MSAKTASQSVRSEDEAVDLSVILKGYTLACRAANRKNLPLRMQSWFDRPQANQQGVFMIRLISLVALFATSFSFAASRPVIKDLPSNDSFSRAVRAIMTPQTDSVISTGHLL